MANAVPAWTVSPTAKIVRFLLVALVLALPTTTMPVGRSEATNMTFATGDVFVTTEDGQIQWRHPNGTLNRLLAGVALGKPEGIRLDATGNLYVTHWCASAQVTSACSAGNTVEKFNTSGVSQGIVGSGYNCNPHAVAFDAAGGVYVGQADCTGAVLKFQAGHMPVAYAVAPETRGSFWIDLAADGCTLLYTSIGPNVKRFDACADTQRTNFNAAPLPGGVTHDLRVLPDGGVLVSSGSVVARLDARGRLVKTYTVLGLSPFWSGLDLVGDGTFWAADYYSSNVYRFDLTTGVVLATFNTATQPLTVTGVAVVKSGMVQ